MPSERKRARYSRSPSRERRGKRRTPDRSPSRERSRRRRTPDRHRRRSVSSEEDGRRRGHRRGSPGPPRRQSFRDSPRRADGARPREALSDEPPALGSVHRALVQSIRPFGIFLQLEGFAKQALVHSSQVDEELSFSREDEDAMKVKGMAFYFPEGSAVWAKVTDVREEGPGHFKIACSLKAVNQDTGEDLDPQGALAARGSRGGGDRGSGLRRPESDAPPPVGIVLRATVANIKPYGIFVHLDGYRDGLVHFTQVSNHLEFGKSDSDEERLEAMGSVHAAGDPLWVKVTEVREEEGAPSARGPRIACSIKVVDQGTGRDLDPENAAGARPLGGRPGGGTDRGRIGESAGAVQQGGDIDWGHLQADGPQVPQGGSGGYALISNAEINALPAPPPPPPGFLPKPSVPEEEQPTVTSVEEALAIMQKYGKGKEKKSKKGVKEKKHKSEKGGKKGKKLRHKKSK